MASKRQKLRPTIIDVARQAGVSKSTVARALSDSAHINEDTRNRVMKAVQKTGYERNHLARSLRSGRSHMLGLVIPDIANPFWAEVARGAQDKAAANGASLLVFSSDWNPEREASHLRALRQARVDGALVNPVEDSIDELERFGMPVVLIGSSAERFPDLPSVGSDIAQGVRLGLDRLVALGHRTPCVLVGPVGRLARARFLRVVREHYLARDVDPDFLVVEEGEYSVQSGREAMTRLLAKTDLRPLSVFAANDLMALGALLGVRDAGLVCPDDVSILGFDGIPGGVFSYPGLSTIEKPSRAIGERGVELLVEGISGQSGNAHLVLPCRFEERGSLMDISRSEGAPLAMIG